jgi:hypothetical protein
MVGAGQGFPSKCIEPGGWDVIEVVREDQMDAAFIEYESSTASTLWGSAAVAHTACGHTIAPTQRTADSAVAECPLTVARQS